VRGVLRRHPGIDGIDNIRTTSAQVIGSLLRLLPCGIVVKRHQLCAFFSVYNFTFELFRVSAVITDYNETK
jgi:hypothetical protein